MNSPVTSHMPELIAELAPLLVPAIRDAVVVTDADGLVTYWNDGATRVFGWTAEERIGRPLVERLPEHARPDVATQMRAVLAGAEWRGECEDYRKDGSRVWLDASVRAVTDAGGGVVGILGIAEDITIRKRAEAALHDNAERLRLAMGAAHAGAWDFDVETGRVNWSPENYVLCGLPPGQELTHEDVGRTVLAEDRDSAVRELRDALEGRTVEYRSEFRVSHPDRGVRWLLSLGNVQRDEDGRPRRMSGINLDITERKRAESAVTRHNRVLELNADGAPIESALAEVVRLVEEQLSQSTCMICLVDAANRVRVAASSTLPRALVDLFDGGIAHPLNGSCGAAIASREPVVCDIATSPLCASWRTVALGHGLRSCLSVPLLASGTVSGIPRGRVLGTFAVYGRQAGPPDARAFAIVAGALTEAGQGAPAPRPASEMAIASAAHLARTAIERRAAQEERDYLWNHSPDPVCIAGDDGMFRQVNPAWTTTLGWTAGDLRSRPWLSFVHADDREATRVTWNALVDGMPAYGFVNRFLTRDGSYRWLSWNALPVPAQRAIYGFARDVTEERQLADQVRQSQKMEAIGRLAGGVAHDFNNLLTVINGYTALLLGNAPPDSVQAESLSAVRDAGERAATLTAQLLAFSRKAIVEPRILDINRAVESSVRLLRRLVGEHIRLETDFAPDLPCIRLDPGQFEQVVINLVVNGRDAMPNGGCLRVSTGECLLTGAASAGPDAVPDGRYVRLTIADTGSGMSDEVQRHLFEPFFTTKGIGKGTGLGLATVYGIVRQAGGTIDVETSTGRGSRFHLLFPACDAVDTPVAEPVAQVSPTGHETVLLVEDEPAVRQFTRLSLELQGYAVIEAASAPEALATPADTLAGVALLITDVVMPGPGGRPLADAIRQRLPHIRVLFISGYTNDAVVIDALDTTAADGFLQKPFTPQGLARKVRDVLDARD